MFLSQHLLLFLQFVFPRLWLWNVQQRICCPLCRGVPGLVSLVVIVPLLCLGCFLRNKGVHQLNVGPLYCLEGGNNKETLEYFSFIDNFMYTSYGDYIQPQIVLPSLTCHLYLCICSLLSPVSAACLWMGQGKWKLAMMAMLPQISVNEWTLQDTRTGCFQNVRFNTLL